VVPVYRVFFFVLISTFPFGSTPINISHRLSFGFLAC
jgi:hypothetical protein